MKIEGGNTTLNNAFLAKKDEFYTCYEDVEKEVIKYKDQLKGKSILCNCDDPFESAFFLFFVNYFNEIGISKLVSTSYTGSDLRGRKYSCENEHRAYKAVLNKVPKKPVLMKSGSLDIKSLFSMPENSLSEMSGNGDFRSEECVELLKDSDVVITNPPFSLFREYVNILLQHRKKFLILGNMNASTYKEVFPLFKNNHVWYGETIRSGDRKFYVPDSYPLNASNCGIDDLGRKFIRVKGVRWFTNLENSKRHEFINLNRLYNPEDYPVYENYNAIEVSRTQNIPIDYDGVMGVPITFLDKYNPDQFEIIMLANGNTRTNVISKILNEVKYQPHPEDRGGVGIISGRRVYARILIRKKKYE